jgi:hypothetical protein
MEPLFIVIVALLGVTLLLQPVFTALEIRALEREVRAAAGVSGAIGTMLAHQRITDDLRAGAQGWPVAAGEDDGGISGPPAGAPGRMLGGMNTSFDERWHELLGELTVLRTRKAHDYGDEDGDNLRSSRRLGLSPYLGVLLRMNDKMSRLCALSVRGGLVSEESVTDTLRDLACYCLLAIMLCEEEG